MVLDLKKKRPVKIPKEILQLGAGSDNHVLDERRENIETISGQEPDYITKVGRQDLDMNNHVNNVKYVEWITGHHDDDSLKCNELKIQYISEARLGDNIYLSKHQKTEQNSKHFLHTLYSGSGDKIIAKSKSFWR
jgi:medium-chain acyl-[acyl-carrier-protein] hydrolase